jgi:hypothetical protein
MNHESRITALLASCVYFLALLLAVIWCCRNPLYNWDMIPYAAQALLFQNHNLKAVHDEVYSAMKAQVPGAMYDSLTRGPYLSGVAKDESEFAEQLPFYSTKPLYVMAVYLSHRLGFNLAEATVVPSVLSYALLGVLVFVWIGQFIAGFYRAVFSALIVFSPPVILLARLSAPDALAALTIMGGIYFLVEKQWPAVGSALLLLSILARTNDLIIVVLIFGYLAFWGTKELRLGYAKSGVLACTGVLTVLVINHFSGFYGWRMLFYTSVLGHLTTPAETLVRVSPRAYLGAVKQGFFAMALKGFQSSFALLGFLAIYLLRDEPSSVSPYETSAAKSIVRLRVYRHLAIGLLATIPLYFLLLPSAGLWFIEERYFSPQYLFLAVACVAAVGKTGVSDQGSVISDQ